MKIDKPLLIITLALLTFGLIMIFSTSSVVGLENYNDSFYFIKKYFIYLFLGAFFFWLGLKIPYESYKKIAFQGLIFSIFLLFLTLIPGFSIKALGAKRWLAIGFFQIQPVEITKFFIAVFLAVSLENKKYAIESFKKGLLPILVLIIIPLGIVAKQPDLGNIILISSITFILFFLANARMKHLVIMAMLGFVCFLFSIFTNHYQMLRVKAFLFPWADPLGKNYHVIQSMIAIGSGGLIGNGIGQSKLKYYYLPMQYTDFIFAIICEEGGFIFAVITVLLFGALLFRGSKLAFQAKNDYAKYLMIALVLFLVLQGLINIGVVIGVLPVTGIPLTFISFGGTSLITSLFYMGVVLNISKRACT